MLCPSWPVWFPVWSIYVVRLTDHRSNIHLAGRYMIPSCIIKLQALRWIWSGEEDNPFYQTDRTFQKANGKHPQKPHTTPFLWMRKDTHSLCSHSSTGQQAKYLCQAWEEPKAVVPPDIKSDSLDELVSSSGKHWDVKGLLVENQLISSRHTHTSHIWKMTFFRIP